METTAEQRLLKSNTRNQQATAYPLWRALQQAGRRPASLENCVPSSLLPVPHFPREGFYTLSGQEPGPSGGTTATLVLGDFTTQDTNSYVPLQ